MAACLPPQLHPQEASCFGRAAPLPRALSLPASPPAGLDGAEDAASVTCPPSVGPAVSTNSEVTILLPCWKGQISMFAPDAAVGTAAYKADEPDFC